MTNQRQAYLFVGNDDYPLSLAARQLVNERVPLAEQAFGLEVIEGRASTIDEALATIKRCHEALVTPGFLMVRGKVIWWRMVSFLGDAEVVGNEDVKAEMKDLASALEDGRAGEATLLVTAPAVDKRSAFYKLFASRFEVREFMLPDKAYLVERVGRDKIRMALEEKGISADTDAVELMLSRVGADSRLIAAETEKLALFLGDRRRVGLKDVQVVVSSTLTSVMWDLQDAVGDRRLPDALEVLRELLASKEHALAIVSSLMGRMRDLLLYREALDQGWLRIKGGGRGDSAEWGEVPGGVDEVLSSVLKRDPRTVHPFVVGKMAQQARRFSVAALRRNQRLLMDTYETLVSSRVPEQTELELMLVRIMAA